MLTLRVIFKLVFLALVLRFETDAISDPFTRSCPPLQPFSKERLYAFEGKITNLLRDGSGYLTAEVRVLKIYKGTANLAAFETLQELQNAYSCGYFHRVGDVRLWVATRHSNGRLAARASVANLDVNILEVQQLLRGKIDIELIKSLEIINYESVKFSFDEV